MLPLRALFTGLFTATWACSPLVTPAQTASPPAVSTTSASRLTRAARTAALREIERKFQELYVFPEMRPTIVARLEESSRAGRYDVDDPALFADRITKDLKDVAHDEHLAPWSISLPMLPHGSHRRATLGKMPFAASAPSAATTA